MRERTVPKPNCSEELDVGTIEFGRLGRRVVAGRFDGGSMSGDGGVMLLGAKPAPKPGRSPSCPGDGRRCGSARLDLSQAPARKLPICCAERATRLSDREFCHEPQGRSQSEYRSAKHGG